MKITNVEVSVRPAFNRTKIVRRAKNKSYVVSFQVSESELRTLFHSTDSSDNIGQQIVDEILGREWLPEHIAWVRGA